MYVATPSMVRTILAAKLANIGESRERVQLDSVERERE